MVAVSLPDMVTNSQFNNAIGGIIEPIKRERANKEEMQIKRQMHVSKRYSIFVKLVTYDIPTKQSYSACTLNKPPFQDRLD